MGKTRKNRNKDKQSTAYYDDSLNTKKNKSRYKTKSSHNNSSKQSHSFIDWESL